MKNSILLALSFVLLHPIYGQDAITALEEIVALRQSILDREAALNVEDRALSTNILDLHQDLLNAKVDLASAKGDFQSVISFLSDIQKLQTKRLDELKLLMELGKLDTKDLEEQKIRILKTQIRIAGARDRKTGAEQDESLKP